MPRALVIAFASTMLSIGYGCAAVRAGTPPLVFATGLAGLLFLLLALYGIGEAFRVPGADAEKSSWIRSLVKPSTFARKWKAAAAPSWLRSLLT